MADTKQKKRKKSKSRGFGGGRFGIDMTETGLAALSGWIGKMVAGWLSTFNQLPDFVTQAEPSDVGLYALGVLFKRRSLRSVGAGLMISRSILIGG